MSASVEEERRLLRGRVDMVVVGKLSEWEKRIPVILLFPNEDAQVLLELLVNVLGLPISLRVIV